MYFSNKLLLTVLLIFLLFICQFHTTQQAIFEAYYLPPKLDLLQTSIAELAVYLDDGSLTSEFDASKLTWVSCAIQGQGLSLTG